MHVSLPPVDGRVQLTATDARHPPPTHELFAAADLVRIGDRSVPTAHASKT